MVDKQSKSRLNKREWLEKAMDVLSKEGGARLSIEVLARRLHLSKGSFYWHFESREDFVRQLLDHWHERNTINVTQHVGISGLPEERFRKLIAFVIESGAARYDMAMRSWAIQEPAIRPLVRRTDVFRQNFVRSLLEELGFGAQAADMRSRMFITYAAMSSAIFDQPTRLTQAEQIEQIYAVLIAPAAGE